MIGGSDDELVPIFFHTVSTLQPQTEFAKNSKKIWDLTKIQFKMNRCSDNAACDVSVWIGKPRGSYSRGALIAPRVALL
jgi:hypothetical protein